MGTEPDPAPILVPQRRTTDPNADREQGNNEQRYSIDNDARLRLLEQTTALHQQRLGAQDTVNEKLASALEALLVRFDKFQLRLLIVGVVIFSGTDNGAELLQLLTGALK